MPEIRVAGIGGNHAAMLAFMSRQFGVIVINAQYLRTVLRGYGLIGTGTDVAHAKDYHANVTSVRVRRFDRGRFKAL